jgi:glycine/D-amino acid oxidase-like deaminating enzyme
MTRVLISGASVAGLATAYWFEQQGYSVTVVGRHDGPRPGGQAIDVRGCRFGVAGQLVAVGVDERRAADAGLLILSGLQQPHSLQNAQGGTHERGFAHYDDAFRDYVERTQRLVDLDEGMNGGPIAPDDFHNVVHSIEPKDY